MPSRLLRLINFNVLFFLDVTIFNDTEKENFAHLLASMHLAISELDRDKQINPKFSHITNTTFERFVEQYVAIFSVLCRLNWFARAYF